jgi:hypothetical protein
MRTVFAGAGEEAVGIGLDMGRLFLGGKIIGLTIMPMTNTKLPNITSLVFMCLPGL